MEQTIICSKCGHSIDKHFEDYDGNGSCKECREVYPDPDYTNNENALKWCFERPVNIEVEYLRKQVDILERKISILFDYIHYDRHAQINREFDELEK